MFAACYLGQFIENPKPNEVFVTLVSAHVLSYKRNFCTPPILKTTDNREKKDKKNTIAATPSQLF